LWSFLPLIMPAKPCKAMKDDSDPLDKILNYLCPKY